ncbi:hypothetical protein BC829DRAFT_487400 [Chytridium lagenaria]|nr:hypothetical protein BC829DRAFT_487400 [Chytridium lagenaria]
MVNIVAPSLARTIFIVNAFVTAAVSVSATTIGSSVSNGPISISIISNLEPRQSSSTPLTPTSPTIPECESILEKAKSAIDKACSSYTVSKPLPLSDSDSKSVVEGFNNAAASNCASSCTTAGVPFAEDVTKSCPADYVYSFEGTGIAAADLVKDRLNDQTKTGLCTKTADGNYCVGNVMAGLFSSVKTDKSTDDEKYKAAVCQECVRVWVNSNYTPLEFNNRKIDADEVNKICGESFQKGLLAASSAYSPVAISGFTTFSAFAAAVAIL